MKVSVSLVLILFSVSAFSQSLDKHHLLLDSQLEASSKSRYAFRTLQEAVAHFTDETTLYVAPGVYWVDHPDTPKVVVGADGREPFGMVGKFLQRYSLQHLHGSVTATAAHDRLDGRVPECPKQISCPFLSRTGKAMIRTEHVFSYHRHIAPTA